MTSSPFARKKTPMIATAVAAVLGVTAGTAHAAAVTGITIQDVGSSTANGPGNYSATLDGESGGFSFLNPINPASYSGASPWTGDAGTGTLLGDGAANTTGSFSTGFTFSGSPFVPYTFGSGLTADITSNVLTVTTLDFGGNFQKDGGTNFDMPPDDVFPVEVLWVVPRGNGSDFDVAFRWGHDITSAEDPSLLYQSKDAHWIIEGCATTSAGGLCVSPVPVPATAWLFGTGLAGLAGVARRRKASVKKAR